MATPITTRANYDNEEASEVVSMPRMTVSVSVYFLTKFIGNVIRV